MPDQELTCVECKKPFVFTEGDQTFYQERGFTPPKRCKTCRAANKERTGRSQDHVVECCAGMAELVRRRMVKTAGAHPLLVIHFGKQETMPVGFCPCCGWAIKVEGPSTRL